VGEGLP